MEQLLQFLDIEIHRPNYESIDRDLLRRNGEVILDVLYSDWACQSQKLAGESNLDYSYRLFSLNRNGLAQEECNQRHRQSMSIIHRFRSIMIDFEMLSKMPEYDTPPQTTRRDRLSRIITAINMARTLVITNNRMDMLKDKNTTSADERPEEYILDIDANIQTRKPILKLLYFCLDKLAELRARRHDGYVMVPHITQDGYNSSSYKRYCQVERFPSRVINQVSDNELWNLLVETEGRQSWLIKLLNNMDLTEFPDLIADRHVFAFDNGIYDAKANTFDPFLDIHRVIARDVDDDDDDDNENNRDTVDARYFNQQDQSDSDDNDDDMIIGDVSDMSEDDDMRSVSSISDIGSTRGKKSTSIAPSMSHDSSAPSPGHASAMTLLQKEDGVLHGRVACKYFEGRTFDGNTKSRDERGGWRDIDTDDLDKVFKEQQIYDVDRVDENWNHGRVYEIVLAMMGRMLFDVNEMDEWQIALFLKGVAGSGKSTLLRVIKSFYNTNDVAIMSNNIEHKFGLHPLCNKYVTLCYEMRSNFGLDQAELQSIVSGEELTLAVKNKLANVAHTWKSPFAAAGNMMANWEDSQGSISRRFLMVEFVHQVVNSDPQLFSRLEKNIPNILLKCVRAYLELVKKHNTSNLWRRGDNPPLPEYFHKTREAMTRTTNSLVSFLKSSGEVTLEQGMRMPWLVFKEMYNNYCKTSGMKAQAIGTSDSYLSIFQLNGLILNEETEELEDPETGQRTNCRWIYNIAPTVMGMRSGAGGKTGGGKAGGGNNNRHTDDKNGSGNKRKRPFEALKGPTNDQDKRSNQGVRSRKSPLTESLI